MRALSSWGERLRDERTAAAPSQGPRGTISSPFVRRTLIYQRYFVSTEGSIYVVIRAQVRLFRHISSIKVCFLYYHLSKAIWNRSACAQSQETRYSPKGKKATVKGWSRLYLAEQQHRLTRAETQGRTKWKRSAVGNKNLRDLRWIFFFNFPFPNSHFAVQREH